MSDEILKEEDEPMAKAKIPMLDAEEGITELEDGSVLIDDREDDEKDSAEFGANLAESLPESDLTKIANDLLELIEKDKKAREERDKLQEEGIRRTGLGDDAPGGAAFSGASKVVHPLLAEGCVDFSARAIKELFPANGPVKTKLYGITDDHKLDKAKDKRDFLNWYISRKMPEYRPEKEALLTQLPLGGSQYEKYWFDGKRIRMEFVPIDTLLLPFAATSFYTTPRATHIRTLTEALVEESVDDEFYRDIFDSAPGDDPEQTSSQKASDTIEGKKGSGYNEDGLRIIYEVNCTYDIEGKGRLPYVVHIDEPTGKIAAIYRNWKEDDEDKEKLDWWVEDKFIPWRGAYGIGLPHLIGGLAATLTGALRALLDSAHINNAPSAIKLKGARASGQNINLDITAVTEIEAPAGTTDIRQVMMPIPFNPPSPVLFQLLDWITNQAKGVVATAEEKIADAGNNMPVGTTLALIEQGSMTFSSIHARLHDSQRRALQIISRLIHDYPEHVEEALRKFNLTAEDFDNNDDVEPVSDPNIFSEAQRFAQLQEVLKVAGMFQDLPWKRAKIARRALELLRVDDVDSLLPSEPEPVTGNAVVENAAAMRNVPISIGHDQDHAVHMQTHLEFLLSPFGAANPLTPPAGLAQILAHVQEHINANYVQQLKQGVLTLTTQHGLDPEQAAQKAQQMLAQNVPPQIAQMVQAAMEAVQKRQPQPPMPPEVTASLKIAEMDNQRKTQLDQATLQSKQAAMEAKTQMEQSSMQLEQQSAMAKAQLDGMQAQFDQQLAQQKLMLEQQISSQAQQVEFMKNEADNRQHQMTELLKNRDDNETAMQMKLMELQNAMAEGFSQVSSTKTDVPDNSGVVAEMQSLLGQIEKAKTNEALGTIMESLRGMMATMSAPTELVRGADGKAIGMRKLVAGE